MGERTLDRLILMLVLIGYYAGVARFGNVSEECKYTASFLEISDTAYQGETGGRVILKSCRLFRKKNN